MDNQCNTILVIIRFHGQNDSSYIITHIAKHLKSKYIYHTSVPIIGTLVVVFEIIVKDLSYQENKSVLPLGKTLSV